MSVIFAIVMFYMSIGYAQLSPDLITSLRAFSVDSVKGWKKGVTFFISTSQTSLTNWSSGGQNSISINGLASVYINYREERINWDNSFDFGYGILKQGRYQGFIKTDDKIDLISKYGLKAFKGWYYATLFNFKTQLNKGFNYPNDSMPISKFLAPGYLLAAVGLDYKRNDLFSAFISPFTSKVTLVNDPVLADSGAFGVERGERLRSEMGGYVRMIFKRDINKNVSFSTKIDLFSNYLHNPQNIDINWEMFLILKASEFFSASLTTHLIYDDDIKIERDTDNDGEIDLRGARIQFKEVLSIGITFRF